MSMKLFSYNYRPQGLERIRCGAVRIWRMGLNRGIRPLLEEPFWLSFSIWAVGVGVAVIEPEHVSLAQIETEAD